jgi:hypothetical protein
MEAPTDTVIDVTTDPKWINEQIDRLLAWEVLQREFMCVSEPMEILHLCDSIGVNKGFVHSTLVSIRKKLYGKF